MALYLTAVTPAGLLRAAASHPVSSRKPCRVPATVKETRRLRRVAVLASGENGSNGASDWAHGQNDEIKKLDADASTDPPPPLPTPSIQAASEFENVDLPADLVSLAQAEARVMAARAALEEFERDVARASELEQARAASERGALADLQQAEQELAIAEAELRKADSDRQAARGKDNLISLLFSSDDQGGRPAAASSSSSAARGSRAATPIDQDAERIESAKAATISAVAGSVAALPLTLVQADSLVAAGTIFVSCALFGVVYRYAVRSDVENNQLKLGATASFGLVRGLGQAESFLRADTQAKALAAMQAAALPPDEFLLGHSLTALAQAALCVGESVVVFLWTGALLEAAMVRNIVLPFGAAGSNNKRQ